MLFVKVMKFLDSANTTGTADILAIRYSPKGSKDNKYMRCYTIFLGGREGTFLTECNNAISVAHDSHHM